jgi:hypothetical protein
MLGTAIENTISREREAFCTSELRKLSSDPAITRHPDPKFHFRFSDPDELGEEEPVGCVVNFTAPPRRTYPTYTDGLLRRSPKE